MAMSKSEQILVAASDELAIVGDRQTAACLCYLAAAVAIGEERGAANCLGRWINDIARMRGWDDVPTFPGDQ